MGIKEKVRPFVRKALNTVAIGHILLFLFTLISLVFIISVTFTPVLNLRVGDVSPRDIDAPRTLEIPNNQATKDAQQKAYDSVQPIYTLDTTVMKKSSDLQAKTFEVLAHMQRARKSGGSLDSLRERLPVDLSDESLNILLAADSATIGQIELITSQLVFEIMKKGVKHDGLSSAQLDLKARVNAQLLPSGYKKAVSEIGAKCLYPDLILD